MEAIRRHPILCSLSVATSLPLVVYGLLFARSMARQTSLAHFVELSFIWQTLIAATYAIVAASIGAAAIVHQTQASARAEEKRRSRRARALHASVSLVLSELCDYALGCAGYFNLIAQPSGEPAIVLGDLTFPALPDCAGQLAELIETFNDEQSQAFVDLIRRLQIQHARTLRVRRGALDRSPRAVPSKVAVNGMVDATEIYARCANLLGYLRQKLVRAPRILSFHIVRENLHFMGLSEANYALAEEEINIRQGFLSEDAPWPEV